MLTATNVQAYLGDYHPLAEQREFEEAIDETIELDLYKRIERLNEARKTLCENAAKQGDAESYRTWNMYCEGNR